MTTTTTTNKQPHKQTTNHTKKNSPPKKTNKKTPPARTHQKKPTHSEGLESTTGFFSFPSPHSVTYFTKKQESMFNGNIQTWFDRK